MMPSCQSNSPSPSHRGTQGMRKDSAWSLKLCSRAKIPGTERWNSRENRASPIRLHALRPILLTLRSSNAIYLSSLRKAYLHILFSPPVSSSHTSTSATPGNPTSSPVNSSSSHASRLQDVLNLLWLDTSHALIHVYRNKVAGMEKAIAEAPNAHRGKGRNGRGGPMPGGAGGARGNNIPGPTARRRLVQSFRTFLKQEEEFFRTLLSRLAVSLYPSDLAGLKSLGVVTPTPEEDDESGVHVTPSAEERKARRSSAVALAHKALICFGDLARYRELYNEPGTGAPSIGAGDGDHKERRAVEKGKSDGDRKLKNWTRAAECYHQARLLLPDNGSSSFLYSLPPGLT